MVALVTQVDHSEAPKGCLLIKMRNSRLHLGEATQQQIEKMHQYQLAAFTQWLEYLAQRGEFNSPMLPAFPATYIVAQLSQALAQIALGEDSETVKAILTTAFSMLEPAK